MRLIGKPLLDDFAVRHADVRASLAAWASEVGEAQWHSPSDIKARYPTASILSENRVVFNIKGNKYRLETKINYELGVVLVVRVGTHSEYSRWMF
jgi:mRNA interferase HigB